MLNRPAARLANRPALRQDACARLLLLISRRSLTADQTAQARHLAESVTDWDEFAKLAYNKFVGSYAYLHLKDLAADIIPASTRAYMQRLAFGSKLASLKVAGIQRRFHDDCISSTGAMHAYLKGPSLAVQSGQEIGDRLCRDLDILVRSADFRAVLDAALARGYTIYIDLALSECATTNRDLDFLSRYADVVTIIDKSGFPIELHRRLDKQSIDFRLDVALSTAENVSLSGRAVSTMAKSLHLNYICYHHARHFWSRLHWVADIHAMITAPGFDLGEVRRIADEIGIRPTVEAALQFVDLAGDPDSWSGTLAGNSGGAQFLAACLYNLDGDLELEEDLRKGMPFSDFMSSWQIAHDQYGTFARRAWLRRLIPTPRQYLKLPLPWPLHWLYVLRNGSSLIRHSIAHAASAAWQAIVQAPKSDAGLNDG